MAQSNGTLHAIGALKLVKGVFLLLVAAGAFRLLRGDAPAEAYRVAQQIGLHRFMVKAANADTATLHKVSAAGLVYGALLSTEGVGLLMDKHWAHWLAVIVTGSFIPIEIYEIAHHVTPIRVIGLILNVAIVVYLITRLRSQGHEHGERVTSS